ncbi:AmmeMemoRadiSam system protein B [Megalodesulfovibrio paquesii]
MLRPPVVAGRFYDGSPELLRQDVQTRLALGAHLAGKAHSAGEGRALLTMVPHAGYFYSGDVAGKTLAAAPLADCMLLLGPNHTGQGAALSLWAQGGWRIPGADVPVDEALAQALLRAEPSLTPDQAAHRGEHSLEVLLPFLIQTNPHCRIVPLAVAEPNLRTLLTVAHSMAGVLRAWHEPVTMLVSSDMSHYLPHEVAATQDELAINRILALDPEGLYTTVRTAHISMCGVLPMTLGLAIARELGAQPPELVAYTTSGEASGDYTQVVGYAGVVVRAATQEATQEEAQDQNGTRPAQAPGIA